MQKSNIISIDPLQEEKDVSTFNPEDVSYIRTARKGYSQMVCVEYPELADICLAFYYFPLCTYAVHQTNRYVSAALERYRQEAIEAGLDAEDEEWQFVLSRRTQCMEQTANICKLVRSTVKRLKAENGRGNADAGRALRALNIYDIETGEKPYKRNEPSQIIFAFQYIDFIMGKKFHDCFDEVRKHPVINVKGQIVDCYHQTELLLEYYKKYLYSKACDKLDILNSPNYDSLRQIVELTKDKMGTPQVHTVASYCAIKLVEGTLSSLQRIKDDGRMLYKSIVRHYINQTPLVVCGLDEWNNSWYNDYKIRDKAIKTYSILLWGYSTVNIMELLESTSRGSKKNVRRERALDI